jgi:hypothetical protein
MGRGKTGGLGGRAFAAWVAGIVAVVALQSVVHLVVVLGAGDLHSVFDLDRSNGVPDLVSTLALAVATAGAAATAWVETGGRRLLPSVLAVALAGLTLADLLHEGAHPSSRDGTVVVALVFAAAVLLGAIGVGAGRRVQVTLLAAACLLAVSFLTSGLDRFDQWFERRRGDPVAEYRIVAKEGLELLGWSLVGLALWDEALRRRAVRTTGRERG